MNTPTNSARFVIRRAEPTDLEAMMRIFDGPRAVWGTMQLPYPSGEFWRKRLTEPPAGYYELLACAGDDVAGELGLLTFPNAPRRWHAGKLYMAVRDDWQGKGAGSALMQAAVDMADKWLNLQRLELEVYTDNAPAFHLYEKFGFVTEGKLSCYGFRDGQYVDAYTMARIKETKRS